MLELLKRYDGYNFIILLNVHLKFRGARYTHARAHTPARTLYARAHTPARTLYEFNICRHVYIRHCASASISVATAPQWELPTLEIDAETNRAVCLQPRRQRLAAHLRHRSYVGASVSFPLPPLLPRRD